MSIQFGIWNLDGRPVEPVDLDRAAMSFAPYGCDGARSFLNGNVGILFRSFHATKESRTETQPHVSTSGLVLTWDGRLDNRAELIRDLSPDVSLASTDVEIVAAAYERWSTQCLKRLIGDWALSVWNPHTKSLILAKDFLGCRHLYYSVDDHQIIWSTTLDPLVRPGKQQQLCEEYIAGWFALFPAAHLTPFIGIHSVPPAMFVDLRPGKCSTSQYWDFNPSKKILYATDAEYEEHFRAALFRAVELRLRSDRPVLAHLSGGMDSPTVVTVGDRILSHGIANAPRLDTISYVSNSEPNWDELPYIRKVEEQRGRCGLHIDVSSMQLMASDHEGLSITPAAPKTAAGKQFQACLESEGYRVVLCGIGGDEVMGGVPTPFPELEDLLVNAQFRMLAHRLKVWALNKRKPWFLLLFEALRRFLPLQLVGVPVQRGPVTWLNERFVKRNLKPLQGYPKRLHVFGLRPSFQNNLLTLDALRRQLACSSLPAGPTYEMRYPLLDRDLLEYLFAVPPDQLVRPGMRRSLMRRALVGIVPEEILTRRRKAAVTRGPRVALSAQWPLIMSMLQNCATGSLDIVNPSKLAEVLQKARLGDEVKLAALIRTLNIEQWLRNLISNNIICDTEHAPSSSVGIAVRC